ncbi:ShlB/FhaC/HecB family hemolysin secretion/activation protein (plasmid) [Azospirillum baldaniorum]|uniref:Haemolysin activator HlyB C-terminal domain-containing protein n=1 Tax=Azospirillum baldaniorum TaxID=1064539 RepID=A0A9P1JZ19_9PROT|nr:ShlB/FhaC/HecB family hemolysin secretion/activation protein [Azospirillum baldaniorum]TWA76328.1 hemolysin activation/secretion protein [Azospirillum brasilense]CCD02527.1 exported protein of unknown function [Azospirillum baldaniorum]
MTAGATPGGRPPSPRRTSLRGVLRALAAPALTALVLAVPFAAHAGEAGDDAARACLGVLANRPPIAENPDPDAVRVTRFAAADPSAPLAVEIDGFLNGSYAGVRLGDLDIDALMRRVNACLFAAGFPTSGVDEVVRADDGAVIYRVRIGRGDDVELVAVDRRTGLPEPPHVVRWLRRMLIPDGARPFSTADLENGWRRARDSGRVGPLSISVRPGHTAGAARVVVEVERPSSPSAVIGATNDLPWALGAAVAYASVSVPAFMPGFDHLTAETARGEGYRREAIGYDGPIGATEHRWLVAVGRTKSRFVEDYFSDLGIRSEALDFDLATRWRVIDDWSADRTVAEDIGLSHNELTIVVGVRDIWTRSYLLGEPFSFDTAAHDGEIDFLEARAGVEMRRRERAGGARLYLGMRRGMRGVASWMHSKIGGGTYSALDAEAEAAYGPLPLEGRLELRARGQWSPDRLLPAARFVLGGSNSVRGIEVGALTGNSGHVESLDLVVPVHADATLQVDGVLFADHGQVLPVEGGAQRVASVGVGVRAALWHTLSLDLYLSRPLAGSPNVRTAGGHSPTGLNVNIVSRF